MTFRLYRLLLLVLLLLNTNPAGAQLLRPTTVFTVRDGLPQMQVLTLMQDSRGLLWTGTRAGGAAFYTGTTFRTLNRASGLLDAEVRGLAETPDGRVWMATRSRLAAYNGLQVTDETARLGPDFGANRPEAVLFDVKTLGGGRLAVATSKGLVRLDLARGSRSGPYGASTRPTCNCFAALQVLAGDRVFFATDGGQGGILDGDRWMPLHYPDGSPLTGRIKGAAEDAAGRLYVASPRGLVVFARRNDGYRAERLVVAEASAPQALSVQTGTNGKVWFRTPSTLVRLSGSTVERFPLHLSSHSVDGDAPLLALPDGWVMTGTEDGLFVYRGNVLQPYQRGFPVTALLADREGNIWVGTDHKGLRLLRVSALRTVDPAVLPGTVWDVTGDGRGGLWAATNTGLASFDAQSNIRRWTTAQGLPHAPVYALGRDGDGNVFLGTEAGVYRFDGSRFEAAPVAAGSAPPRQAPMAVESPDGSVWMLTNAGVMRYRGRTAQRAPLAIRPHEATSGFLAWHDGALWLLLPQRLLRYDGARVDSFATDRSTGLTAFAFDAQHRLWLGTSDDGIHIYDFEDQRLRQAATLRTPEGLADNTVWSVGALSDSTMWVATTRGLSRVRTETVRPGASPVVSTLSHDDGLLGEPSLSRGYLAPEGRLWLGTSEALLRYDSRHPNSRLSPSTKVHLDNVRLFHEPLPAALTASLLPWSSVPTALRLNYRQNTLSFEFSAPAFAVAHRLRFRYRLLPQDTAWSPPLSAREATFSGLPPGSYTLHVQACLNDACNPASQTVYGFAIAPPFWRTWWFGLLSLGVGIGGLTMLVRQRTRWLRLRQRELETLVDEQTRDLRDANAQLDEARQTAEMAAEARASFLATMSHEIRTPLNGVLGFAGLLHDTPLNPEQAEYLATIRSSAHTLLGLLNDVLDFSKIEAGKLDLNDATFVLPDLVEDVTTMLAPLAHAKGLSLAFVPDADVPEALLGDGTRLRQILVNLVGNAIKFTAEGHVAVRARVTPDANGECLHLLVEDTGIGISDDQQARLFTPFMQASTTTASRYGGTGLGLSIARHLAELMGGTISLRSTLGTGTTFDVALPLRPAPPLSHAETRPRLDGLRVAVVADCPAERDALQAVLRRVGAHAVADTADAQATVIVQPLAHPPAVHRDQPVLVLAPTGVAPDLSGLRHARAGRLPVRRRPLVRDLTALLAAPAPAALPVASEAPLRVLIAEDNLVNQRLIRLLVEKMGHRVTMAENGQIALDLAHAQPFDAALLDVQMPVLDGYDTALALADLPRPIPHVAAVTAAVLPEERDRAVAVGFTAFLDKPVQRDQLAAFFAAVEAARRSAPDADQPSASVAATSDR